MAAYVVVVDTPYFAVPDKSGAFTILDVPPGTYAFEAWRPNGSPLSGTFRTQDGNTLDVRWP
jgi:hypothetical protein